MALYHFHVTQVSRGKGQSAVASAAYRAGEAIYDSYYGKTDDFTRKGGVIHTVILAPDHVPGELLDRETLWNTVEQNEKHPKAQLAYSFDIALQNEMSMQENIKLAEQFVREQFVSRGMIADLAVHAPEKDGIPNPHFHVMCPIRPMNEDGTWGQKQKREYILDQNGNRMRDENGNLRFNSVPTTDWGKPETLDAWRKAWADLVNDAFRQKGITAEITAESYAARGEELIPQIHEGPHVRQMEAKGIVTSKGELNRWIREINSGIKTLKKQLIRIAVAIADLKDLIDQMKLKEPDLAECFISYFEERNRQAEAFGYGTRKAKLANIKTESKMIIFLKDNDVHSIADLEAQHGVQADRVSALNDEMHARNDRMQELKDMIRYASWVKEGAPVMQEIRNQRFKKKREELEKEHDAELRRFHVAKRILKGKGFEPVSASDVSRWQKELKELDSEYQVMFGKYKTMKSELYYLDQITVHAREAVKAYEHANADAEERRMKRHEKIK